jgi:undecaprenyl phosphate N,N'-diacetylbacillosamine 1-phosphate transferase
MKLFIYNFLKRLMDLLISILGFIILSPIFLVVWILQLLTYGTNIYFNQKRVGLNGKIFRVFKFKTMNDKKDANGDLLPDHLRVTRLGKTLRAFSLDELPQIFNIIFGQMSVVGPRPQSIENCLFMSEKQFARHNVKPGLTGLSAIKGRNGIPWELKINYDLDYLRRKNIFLDIKIVIITFFKVIFRENVFSQGILSSHQMGETLLTSGKISEKEYKEVLKKAKKVSQDNSVRRIGLNDLLSSLNG